MPAEIRSGVIRMSRKTIFQVFWAKRYSNILVFFIRNVDELLFKIFITVLQPYICVRIILYLNLLGRRFFYSTNITC